MASGIPSYFAPAERDGPAEIRSELDLIMKNPVLDTLLTSIGGLVAILNSRRQILLVNKVLLEQLGLKSVDCILGKRLGEAVECTHAHDMEGGCGTGPYCASCGAVIAMETTRLEQVPCESKCRIEKDDEGKVVDLSFSVRTSPVSVEGLDLILIILKDISSEERWQALERSFFHDLNNVVCSIMGSMATLKLTAQTEENRADFDSFNRNIRRLVEELAVHRVLAENRGFEELTRKEYLLTDEICIALEDMINAHPCSRGKTLIMGRKDSNRMLYSNKTLILRVLFNMLVNAFEAGAEGEEIRLLTTETKTSIRFSVWNSAFIPEETALRIFQRSFSTKAESGRGLGTFGMKLFGEKVLKGKVGFSSSEEEGTTFYFILPVDPEDSKL